MMLRLPEGGHSLFLRSAKGLPPVNPCWYRSRATPEDGKAVPVTTDVLFKSRLCIVTPGKPG